MELIKSYTFENFVALESNLEAKKIAMDFASGNTDFQTLVISSSIGNGATHLACAIINEMNKKEEFENYFLVSFEILILDILKKGELSKKILNNKSVVVIDSYYNWDNRKSKYLISTLKDLNTKIIITCDEKTNVPVKHFLINLFCPNQNDMKTITKKLLIKYRINNDQEIIDLIVEQNFPSVRHVEGFINTLSARSLHEKKIINLNFTINVIEKFKSLI